VVATRELDGTAAAQTDCSAVAPDTSLILWRSVDRDLLLWTFYNATVTQSSAAARRDVNVDV